MRRKHGRAAQEIAPASKKNFLSWRSPKNIHAYPGPRLMAALKERAAAGDAAGTLALAMRITQALQTRSFRQHAGDWEADAEGDAEMPDLLPPGFGETSARRPYFETLIVTGIPAANWSNLAAEWRKLRRSVDAFIYEPVFTGSFEDAFCAAMINPDLAAVIVNEGFAQRSRHDAPVLRSVMAVDGTPRRCPTRHWRWRAR